MGSRILTMLVCFLVPNLAFSETSLFDLLSPDEIAQELLLGPTDYSPVPEDTLSYDDAIQAYGANALHEFPVIMVVSKKYQAATIYHYGEPLKTIKVSTGRERQERAKSGRVYFTGTPSGWYSPQKYVRNHWSNTWEANMEYSIFFNGGIAAHATTPDHYRELGRKASGGCVRMHKSDAVWFWNLSTAYLKATVPSFTRSGSFIQTRDGNIRRQKAPGTLFIVTSH